MIDIWEGFFLISFANIEDYNYVFTGGPWIIMNHYLTVKRWEPNFKPSEAKEISTAIWLRRPQVPIEYYDIISLYHISKKIGKLVKTNIITATSNMGKFAKACVVVDLAKPLTPAYTVEGKNYLIQYEFIHYLCFSCEKVGHKTKLCRENPPSKTVALATNVNGGGGNSGNNGSGSGAVNNSHSNSENRPLSQNSQRKGKPRPK